MAGFRGLFVRKSGAVGTTPVMARKAIAGAFTGSGTFGARPGVISGCVVSGTTGWAYSISAGHLLTVRSAADGAMPWGNDAATIVPTSAAPASGSRKDILYALHNDVDNSDANSDPILGVAQGVASATPVAPAIPVGAIELGGCTIPSGASSTQGGTFVDTFVQHTAARGAPIPVTGVVQRDALTASATDANPITVARRDTGRLERCASAGVWFDVVGGVWAAYLPAMLATGTALNLGTGSSSDGRYQKTGNTYSGWASFTFGTTGVVAGTGTYTFSLPSASAADGTNKVVGTAYLVDSSAGTLRRVGAVLLSSGAANVTIVVDGETSAVNPGGPWAWAASDIIRLSFAYEGA